MTTASSIQTENLAGHSRSGGQTAWHLGESSAIAVELA